MLDCEKVIFRTNGLNLAKLACFLDTVVTTVKWLKYCRSSISVVAFF